MPLLETITLITTSVISILNAMRHLHIFKEKQKRKKNKNRCFRRHSI